MAQEAKEAQEALEALVLQVLQDYLFLAGLGVDGVPGRFFCSPQIVLLGRRLRASYKTGPDHSLCSGDEQMVVFLLGSGCYSHVCFLRFK